MIGGKKHDEGKLRYDLMPPFAEAEVIRVLTFGADKYGPDNWRLVDQAQQRYLAAAMRHLAAYRQGSDTRDDESGLHHLAHAACCLLFLIELGEINESNSYR